MKRYIFHLTIISCILFFSSCDIVKQFSYTPDYNKEDTFIPPLYQQSSISNCEISNAGSGENTSGRYNVGDIIPSEFLLQEFNYCYPPDSLGNSFSFATHPNKVFMIEFSATWWGPCELDIPWGDSFYLDWKNRERGDDVEIIHFLDDIGQPHSCNTWGDFGEENIPPIALGTSTNNLKIRDWFYSDGADYPAQIFINHDMQIIDIHFGRLEVMGLNGSEAYENINCMLDEM